VKGVWNEEIEESCGGGVTNRGGEGGKGDGV